MEPTRSDTDRFIPISLLVLAGLLAAFVGLDRLGLPLRIPLNYNEGWGALWGDAAMAGGAIYPSMDAFIVNNYPPLSFYITGALGRVVGDNVIAGRLLSTVSVFSTGFCVWLAARALGAGRRWATAAALAFLLCAIGLFRTYFTIADPQWLAHAVSTPGLVLLLRRAPSSLSARRLAAAAALMLVAGLIKHSLLALPLAVTLWLAWHDRRRLAVWLAICGAGVAVSLVLLYALWGELLFRGVLEHSRVLRAENLLRVVRELAGMAPLFAGAALLALHRGTEPGPRLVLLFAGAATAWCMVQRLGDGIGDNSHFEMLIALAIAAGAGVPAALADGRWHGHGRRAALLAAVLCLPLAGILGREAALQPQRLASLDDQEAQWDRVIATIAATPGRTICAQLSLCYWAGKGFDFDLFSYGQRLHTGDADPAPLDALLGSGEIRRIVLEPYSLEPRNAGAVSVVALMQRHYRQQGPATDEAIMLLPR